MQSPVRAVRPAPIAALLLAATLAGCASAPTTPEPPRQGRPSDAELLRLPEPVPRHEPRTRAGNPPFYEVFGRRYTVLAESSGFVERGVASWYGPGFHGERTSNGERFDMYALTAAHPTLPIPAYVRVTNLTNGRAVTVRVNDRGPFKANRVIDLSYAAALRLDMIGPGTALVEVRAVEPDGPPLPTPSLAAIYAQAGAFAVEDNAVRLRDSLSRSGVAGTFVRRDVVGGRPVFRVRIGPLADAAQFDQLVARLESLGHSDVRLAVD